MKFFSGLCVEIILIMMLAETTDVTDLIKDFVALGFIVEIDNIFAKNMKESGSA
jgi:hypothetical protein